MNRISYLLVLILFLSCSNQNKIADNGLKANEPFVIYKTKVDYYDKIPVTLSNDKTVIVSYPAPSDIKMGDQLIQPILLSDGYLLDQRGINLNVAFTSYTYKEYAALKETPSIEQFFERMIDNDPLLEFYDCQKKLKIKSDLVKVNKMLNKNFKGCVRLK